MIETFLTASWENLIMANYEVDPQLLQAYLPKGVLLDTFEGKAYVSLVGFMFKRTSLFKIPIPFLGTFEEVNLRFYVKRVEGDTVKRGVVFINETVPYKIVAYIANKLYKEHYIAIPTKHKIELTSATNKVRYEWKINNHWNHVEVSAGNQVAEMQPNSLEEFIFEHYYGYTRIDEQNSMEYKVNHPKWLVHKVNDYSVDCDFESMYGKDFSYLKNLQPDSVFLAQGSPISVGWKRRPF
jgi:uncharacterized protein